MLPSARRAELSRHDFDNSYLSRKALAAGSTGIVMPTGTSSAPTGVHIGGSGPITDAHHHQLRRPEVSSSRGGGGPKQQGSSVHSRTTAALTTLEDSEDVDDFTRKVGSSAPGPPHTVSAEGHTRYLVPTTFSRAGSDEDSLCSDDADSLCSSVHSTDSVDTTTSKRSTIRYAESTAGQIWNMLYRMDELVLEVKSNACQCRRLGARLGALKRPMVAVHKGRQTADDTVLVTIKELVTEAQHFTMRFLDPDWWRKGAGRKEDSEMFRELTFRLGFLMQAPPGFQEQSQEEDQADRLQDYADLQVVLEEKLRSTKDKRRANDIMEVLRRIRMREAADNGLGFSEIDYGSLRFDKRFRNLGSGGFGTVSLATLGSVQVSVKKLNNQNVTMQQLEHMRKDVEQYHKLSYDFVVRMIGGCTVRPNLCLVHERAPNNLFDLLHGMEDPVYIPYMEKAAMLYDVARGLQFLHFKKIIHGNLKSTNVMVFDNKRLKVCDFGLPAIREAGSIAGSANTISSAAWTAPEVLDDEECSFLSDIYSFGIVIHEMMTQRVPFAGRSVAKVITAVVAKGHRPGYLDEEYSTLPRSLMRLADVCWTQDPAARPKNLNPIVTELGHIINALGGDPRPFPYEYKANSKSTPGAHGGAETSDQRRIAVLEEELRNLKMQQASGVPVPHNFIDNRRFGRIGSSGSDDSFRGMHGGGHVYGGSGGGNDYGSSGNGYDGSGSAGSSNGYGYGGGGGGGMGLSTAPAPPASYGSGSVSSGPRSMEFDSIPLGIPEERRALRTLYTMTQGPGWINQQGWETNDPNMTRWHGVACGEGGHVTALRLPSNNLQGQIPREMGCLARLNTLVLADNKLEGHIPAELGRLQVLVELNLSMNDLSGAIPSGISQASSLERLYLQCNALNGNIPRVMLNLLNLKILRLDWGAVAATYPFRTYKKASPPLTEAEVNRANSKTRREARQRAKNLVVAPPLQPKSPVSSRQQDRRNKLPPRGSDANSNKEFVTPARSRLSVGGSDSRPVTSTLTAASLVSGPSRNSGLLSRLAGSRRPSLATSDNGPSESEREEFLQNRRTSVYVAPTAPYSGNDGLLKKAEAKKAAEERAVEKTPMKKSAFKIFREMIGGDLHPGYSVDLPSMEQAKRQK